MGLTSDEYGNYHPNPGSPVSFVGARLAAVVQYPGSPDGVVRAAVGTLCIDTVNNVLYENTDGDTTWASLSSGGGGGSGSVLKGSGPPVSTPSGAAIYTDVDTGTLYQWNGSAWI